MSRQALKRGPTWASNPTMPTAPGRYYWDAWKAQVEVVKRGRTLYVTPPCKGAVEIKITPRIGGKFHKVAE